jgi:hypothetical protein
MKFHKKRCNKPVKKDGIASIFFYLFMVHSSQWSIGKYREKNSDRPSEKALLIISKKKKVKKLCV